MCFLCVRKTQKDRPHVFPHVFHKKETPPQKTAVKSRYLKHTPGQMSARPDEICHILFNPYASYSLNRSSL